MLIDLFNRCMKATYTHTDCGGDYAIEVDDGVIYILFECSNGLEDWKNNFAFCAKPYKRMRSLWFCHRGFLKVWKAMKDEIEACVEDILQSHEINQIVCAGHSHGGALSVLATEDMSFLHGNYCFVRGYGFGAPRVLWGYVPKAVKKRLKNFVSVRCGCDIVTHVPPVIFGYRNAGLLVKIGKLGKYGPIKAHYPESYITELKLLGRW